MMCRARMSLSISRVPARRLEDHARPLLLTGHPADGGEHRGGRDTRPPLQDSDEEQVVVARQPEPDLIRLCRSPRMCPLHAWLVARSLDLCMLGGVARRMRVLRPQDEWEVAGSAGG